MNPLYKAWEAREPTTECLKHACSQVNINHKLIYWLLDDQNIVPDVDCVLSVIGNAGDNMRIVRHIYRKYVGINNAVAVVVENNDEYNDLQKYLQGNISDDNKFMINKDDNKSESENEDENENKDENKIKNIKIFKK
jgi:hypothetical protein